MSGPVIFERQKRDKLLRLEVSSFKGHTFGNFREWYSANGEWKPSGKGLSIPLDALPALTTALLVYHGLNVPDGLETGS